MTQLTEWVGRRVALRHRVGERDGRPLHSDAVGELADGGPDAVVVHTRRGPVRVQRAAVTAVRLVPPAPPRRASWAAVARLEGLCADAWPAQVDEPLGAWRLRAAGGYTGRANSALAIGDPRRPIPAALDAVRTFAAEHGVPPRVQVPIGSPWDRAVAAQGWVPDTGHDAEVAVLVGDLAPLVTPGDPRTPGSVGAPRRTGAPSDTGCAAPTDTGRAVEVLGRPDLRWWAVALGREPSTAQRHVLDPPELLWTAFGLVPGIGAIRGAVVEDHLFLSMVQVRLHARRRGHATALTSAMAAWGQDRGARWAVLQVALHNTAARRFHERLGLVEHHRFRYLVPGAVRPDDHGEMVASHDRVVTICP